MPVRVYVAEHCAPCHDVAELVRQGKVSEKVEVVDIETDSGFAEFVAEVLSHGDGAVPSAYKEGRKCELEVDEENRVLILKCPNSDQPLAPQG